MKDVLVSIVNGSDRGYIHECVSSIYENTSGITFDIVVIDNCTAEKGLHQLEHRGVKVYSNKEPMGFSRNHAQILPLIDGYRFVIIFNDDAFLVNNAFRHMVDCADRDERLAIIGCHIEDPDGYLQPSAAPFPGLNYFIRNTVGLDRKKGARYARLFDTYIDYSVSQDVDWVSGCCMMIRTGFIKQHGFLDDAYFMFLEDADICRRAWNAGCRVAYMAEARIVHYGAGSSTDRKGKYKPRLVVERHRSRLRFLFKYAKHKYVVYLIFANAYLYAKVALFIIQGNREEGGRLWNEMGVGILL